MTAAASSRLPRAIWAGTALLVAITWAIAWLATRMDYRHTESDYVRSHANLMRAFEEQTARTIDLIEALLRTVQREYEETGRVDLRAFASLYPDVLLQMARFDAAGDLHESSRPAPARANVADHEYFVHLAAHDGADIVIGRTTMGRALARPVMPVAIRLNDARGRFAGILVGALDPNYFARFYSQLDLGKTGNIYLVGRDGFVRADGKVAQSATAAGRAATPSHALSNADLRKSPLYAPAMAVKSGFLRGTSPLDGNDKLFVFRHLERYPLLVISSAATVEIFAESRIRTWGRIGAAAAGTALLVLLGWLLARASRNLAIDRERAQAASRLKSEFVARVSHELRTPLHGILGFSEYLKGRPTQPAERESAALIKRSGEHLLDVVNAILDLAKIEAGKLELDLADCDVRQLALDAAASYAALAREKGLAFDVEIDERVRGLRRCDHTRVTSMLNNLLDNAVKFTERGAVAFRVTVEGDMVVFVVADTGPGIPEAMKAAVFEPFRQGDPFVTRRHGGSGLGLALVKEMASRMGGGVTLRTVPGEGATFTLRVPLPPAVPRPVGSVTMERAA